MRELFDKPVNCIIFVVWFDVPFKLVVDGDGASVTLKTAFGQTNIFFIVHTSQGIKAINLDDAPLNNSMIFTNMCQCRRR
jgi:hypothetical protein